MNNQEGMGNIQDIVVRSEIERIPIFIIFNDRSEETGVVEMIDQFNRGFIINKIGYSLEDIMMVDYAN